MIVYKIKKSTQKDLLLHLQKCDDLFVPKLSSKVDLVAYAQKITDYAYTFEAWHEADLVGVVASYFNDFETKTSFITNVSVLQVFNNLGIAKELLKMAKEYAVKRGFQKIKLEVHPNNDKAIQLYTKNDFKITTQNPDSITMVLDIK